MTWHFSVSGVDAALWLPPLVAFSISFFTSMGGVSGAFLLLPFQVSVLGYVAPSVSATNHVYNVVAIPSGVYRYFRERRLVWPLTCAVIAGSLPGVFLGTWIRVKFLPDPMVFKLFVGLVLLYLGARLVLDIVGSLRKGTRTGNHDFPVSKADHAVRFTRISWRRVAYTFAGEVQSFAPPGVFALCLVVGIIGGVYGVGGGALIAPFFVAVFKMPVYTVAGASLMGTFITSLGAVAFYHVLAAIYPEMSVAPDWMLGGLFGLGGFCGIYLGARCQKYVPARPIKVVLSACVLFVAVRYVADFFMR